MINTRSTQTSSGGKTGLQTVILIAMMFLGYTMIYIDKLSISISLVPMSKDLGISPSQKGLIMRPFFWAMLSCKYRLGF